MYKITLEFMYYNADFLTALVSQFDLKAKDFEDSKTYGIISGSIPFLILSENSQTLLPKLMV